MYSKLSTLFGIILLAATAAFSQGGNSATPATTPKTQPSSGSDTKVKTPAFRPSKNQIMEGQQVLINEKLYSGKATGIYGDSRDAIKAYQKAHGLEVNGKFDRATLEKMGISLTETKTADKTKSKSTDSKTASKADGPKRPAPFQATDEQIMALQKVLKDARLYDGATDGKRSDALKASIKKYQEANKLSATGGINAATLEKAGIALTDAQKTQVAAQAAYDAAHARSN
ncbi:MAG: peptidoglycan-binding protein [Acidobacteria bacterium]|nr:peptidoglycan-binding protein [Acidobacteriota bacterium]